MAHTLDLFDFHSRPAEHHPELHWPDANRFPLNIDLYKVEEKVIADLQSSADPLIIAGYASLDRLIEFIAERNEQASARILIGFEPFASKRDSFSMADNRFEAEIEHYWLEQGISLLLSAKLILCINRLQKGQVQVRYYSGGERQHAKIYCGDDAVTLGSSNYTEPGLTRQLEANVRFTRNKDSARYNEARQIAENYWLLGKDYNKRLINLLNKLLRVVPWREALARACAELLEGDWANRFIRHTYFHDDIPLWPSQCQGIAQALYILTRHDSVLIADATGAGKTRMGVYLIQALLNQIISSNRIRKGKTLMVCPPAVEMNWLLEGNDADISFDIYSHGTLSHSKSTKHDILLDALRKTQILCVDEGHNFLNFKAQRTQHLLRNMADHTLIFTATPINKSVIDLLRIADLLGADNLEESTLKALQKLLGVKNLHRSLTEDEIDILRHEIQRFTVRRTKQMLNALIKKEPHLYRDRTGRECRFPKHKPKTYTMDETDKDRKLAKQIRDLANKLYAVAFFGKPIELTDYLRKRGIKEEQYLKGRLLSAKKIAVHFIMSSLRSSRAALVEHVSGTTKAIEQYSLGGLKRTNALQGMIHKLERISGKLPENRLSIPLPEWLSDITKHGEACAHDLDIYKNIHVLVSQMTDIRETKKASLLNALLDKQHLILAFDSRPISLAVIQQRLQKAKNKPKVLVATGDIHSSRSELLETFKPGSEEKNVIGLCSDSMAEGVNLQQASALVHLDMPTVVRVAEQRVGRIDRLDTPHTTIEAWWPQDAEEFALASDERFVERYEAVESLLGANMPLPEAIQSGLSSKRLSTRELIEEYEKESGQMRWDGISDAFEPVRSLILGDNKLIPEKTYDYYKHVKARVLSRVSVVKSKKPWAFFAISAGAFGAPRWILLPGFNDEPITELTDVCKTLRENLDETVTDLSMTPHAESRMRIFLERLSRAERLLISRKKQKALEEMEKVIAAYLKAASDNNNQEKIDSYKFLIDMLTNPPLETQPDWDEVASQWLDLIRPIWYEKLKHGQHRLLLLQNIRNDLIKAEDILGDKIITHIVKRFPILPLPDKRISACIIGVDGN